jgi:hypothetical protein
MILTGFDIENWSCIKRVSVSTLPATGVIVIHGPNRTGKSSIAQALRCCLMDYSSTSTALKARYPRGTAEKPVVTVGFRSGGVSYRITKQFGTSKSKFESQTSEGAWKVETTSGADAHERTCRLIGGDDSTKGLMQLLWLTQTEFHLPDPKKLDANVQAQLRGILGVLQTPLDDRFIERVRQFWNNWHSGQRKQGKDHAIKDGCKLAEYRRKLDAGQTELKESEDKFKQVEGLIRQTAELTARISDLQRQLREQTTKQALLRAERDQSQDRIKARQRAETDHAIARNELKAAQEEETHRADATKRCQDCEGEIEPTRNLVNDIARRVKLADDEQVRRHQAIASARNERRDLEERAERVAAKVLSLSLTHQLSAAQGDYEKAKSVDQDIAAIETFLEENPAPDDAAIKALKLNRQRLSRLEAERDAAAMVLRLAPEPGCGPTHLALDGRPAQVTSDGGEPNSYSVRRKADLQIAGWGRLELSRGTDSTNLDQIELTIRQCNEEFANVVAPLGISTTLPQALDLVLERKADHGLRNAELIRTRAELTRIAPRGINELHKLVTELQTKLQDILPPVDDGLELPNDTGELHNLTASLKLQLAAKDRSIEDLQNHVNEEQERLVKEREAETAAKETLAGLNATKQSRCEELARLRKVDEIADRIRLAVVTLEETNKQLVQTALTPDELTIVERLNAVDVAVSALQTELGENTSKYDIIKGRLLESEGLHAQRAAVGARVDELTRRAEREELERQAVDRLYALFEECREKQLGTRIGPIHDRVLNWMRVLDLGDYKEVRFNDAFLPERLMSRDETGEFAMGEESTGAQEQIAMLVRLALGSVLSSPSEPTVAILDDPLTHCDVGRLNKMRVILRRAAEGDALLIPPAGPLQILVFTCHPEWFRDEKATVIDLENPDIACRHAV